MLGCPRGHRSVPGQTRAGEGTRTPMQIRLTVLGPRSGRAARSNDVLVTAPAGTPLGAVAGALASGSGSGQPARASGSTPALYAGSERLDPAVAVLGVPPLVDGAVLSLHAPAEQHAGPRPGTPSAARLHVVGGPDAGASTCSRAARHGSAAPQTPTWRWTTPTYPGCTARSRSTTGAGSPWSTSAPPTARGSRGVRWTAGARSSRRAACCASASPRCAWSPPRPVRPCRPRPPPSRPSPTATATCASRCRRWDGPTAYRPPRPPQPRCRPRRPGHRCRSRHRCRLPSRRSARSARPGRTTPGRRPPASYGCPSRRAPPAPWPRP